MQPDSELLALKPQWLPNRKGASSVFPASKGDQHDSERPLPYSALIGDPHLRAPPLSSAQRQPGNSHTLSASPSPSSASAATGPRSSYFSSAAPSSASHHGHSQREGASNTSWKPASASSSGNLQTSSSSPLLAPSISVSASPRTTAPAPTAPSSARRATELSSEPFGQSRGFSTRDTDRPLSAGRGSSGSGAADAGAAWGGSSWTPPGSAKGAGAGGPDGARGGAPAHRVSSALLEPASPPPATGQAVYQKVVFDKEFPSLKDSKHPLGYAPKEAPYKQTFLSSRVTGNWTSKLAEVPAAAVQQSQAAAAAAAPSSGVAGGGLGAEAALAGPRPRLSASGDAGAGAGGRASATAAPPVLAGGGWGSFALAAGTGGPGAGGAGSGSGSAAGSNGLSSDKLREQLAVKQSKQLIPVVTRKDDSSALGAVRGRQTVLGGVTAGGRGLGGATGAGGAARGGAGAGAGGATGASQLSLQAGGKLLLSTGSSAVLSNGTVLLTKRAAAPLDRPLMPVATTAAAPAASVPLPASPAAVGPGSQDLAAGAGEAKGFAGFGAPLDPRGVPAGPESQVEPQPHMRSEHDGSGSSSAGAGAGAGGQAGGEGSGGRASGMRELLVPEQGSRQVYAVAYSALVDGAADEGGKVAVLLPAGAATYDPPALAMRGSQPALPGWSPLAQRHGQQSESPPAIPQSPTPQHQAGLQDLASSAAGAEAVKAAFAPGTLPPAPAPAVQPTCMLGSDTPAAAAPPPPCNQASLGAHALAAAVVGAEEAVDQQSLDLPELASFLPGDLLAPSSVDAGVGRLPQLQSSSMGESRGEASHGSTGGGAAGVGGLLSPAAAAKFMVSSEEEEFLRSLGWTDADDGTDDVLTEEEIAAFQASAQARACSPGVQLMGSVACVAPAPAAHVPAAASALPVWGNGSLPPGMGYVHASAAGLGVGLGMPKPAAAMGGLLGCGIGGFGVVAAPAMAAGYHPQPLHLAGQLMGGPQLDAGLRGFGAQRGTVPVAVPAMGVPGISARHGAKVAACSFGSEVSVTDSEDL